LTNWCIGVFIDAPSSEHREMHGERPEAGLYDDLEIKALEGE
jgi:hypothetical protein